jgi:PIN domain nuclease of toxin-antitoxin system
MLSPKVAALIKSAEHTLFISLVSVWEMQIKKQRGKLDYEMPLQEMIYHQQETSRMKVLPITLDHILALDRLPNHHKDPFDRLLIAQAIVEQATMITHDPLISKYSIQTIW